MKVHIFGKKQVLYVVLAIILLCIGMVCALLRSQPFGCGRGRRRYYRLGFELSKRGRTAVANASQEYLRNFDALYVGDANKKRSTSRLMPALKTATRREFWTRSKNTA